MPRTGLIALVALLLMLLVSGPQLSGCIANQHTQLAAASERPGRAALAADITVNTETKLGPVNKAIFGSYVISAGGGNGLLDATNEFDATSLALLRDLQPQILRMADKPIFEDAIGPQASRPSPRCGEDSWWTNGYGLDEHMALLEQIGAPGQALLFVGYPFSVDDSTNPRSCLIDDRAVNLDQMIKRAMAMVAYANGRPDDTTVIGTDSDQFHWGTVGSWALKRQQNGHPEPYDVRYWELGNEIYFRTEKPITPEQYASDYIAFRSAMKQVDPTIKLGIGARIEQDADASWNEPLLAALKGNLDALVLHMYYPDTVYSPDLNPVLMAASSMADSDLARLRQLIAKYVPQPERVSLFLGENGVLFTGAEHSSTWNRAIVGVYDADMIGLYINRSGSYGIDLAVQHWIHGASPTADIAFDWATTRRYLRPDYYALQMWTRHFGDTLVDVTAQAPTFNNPVTTGNIAQIGNIPYLAAHASLKGDRLYLMVINRHLSDAISTQIHLRGFVPEPKAWVYTLNGPDANATNEAGNHDSVKITPAAFSEAATDFGFVFPAHSVTAIVMLRSGAVDPHFNASNLLPFVSR